MAEYGVKDEKIGILLTTFYVLGLGYVDPSFDRDVTHHSGSQMWTVLVSSSV